LRTAAGGEVDDGSLRLSEGLRTMRAMDIKIIRPSLAIAAAAIAAGSMLLAPATSQAQTSRKQVDAIVKDELPMRSDDASELVTADLIRRPESAGEAAMNSVMTVKPVADRSAIERYAPLLFSSRHQVTLGNPEGDVTLVEFFDYNCGFCKRALFDMLALINDDPNLRVVLKEYPILGPGSIDAARVAVAVRMEDPGGQKYLGFHQELLGGHGPASKEKALVVAVGQGLDLSSLKRDMASDEVRATIAEDMKLANAVGINGTPGYVIGNNVVLGAVGITALKARIAAARGQRIN
jgi:protein-disulfide isomerase